MKSIYSLLVIGSVTFTLIASVHADTDENETASNSSGVTMTGQNWKNEREQLREENKQKREQLREENKQKREEIKNRRNGSGATNTGIIAEQLTCVRTAVAKREASILSASSVFAAATNSGLIARAAALDTAWSITGSTERKIARLAAWTNWKNTVKAAQTTNKTSRNTVWKTYRTEAQTCKVPEALTETEGGDVKMEQDWTNRD